MQASQLQRCAPSVYICISAAVRHSLLALPSLPLSFFSRCLVVSSPGVHSRAAGASAGSERHQRLSRRSHDSRRSPRARTAGSRLPVAPPPNHHPYPLGFLNLAADACLSTASSTMVCKKCEKKLSKVAAPDPVCPLVPSSRLSPRQLTILARVNALDPDLVLLESQDWGEQATYIQAVLVGLLRS
jgi:hypothetical protein